jgi:hypothetical protein
MMAAWDTCDARAYAAGWDRAKHRRPFQDERDREWAYLLRLLKCVVLCHRDEVALPPLAEARPWLARNDGAAGKLAVTMARDRNYADLPVLADALEDGGCEMTDLLEHLRGPGPHGHGCSALRAVGAYPFQRPSPPYH